MAFKYKPGELITLTKKGEVFVQISINNSLKINPKTGDPLLFLKHEPAQILHFTKEHIVEDGRNGGFRGTLSGFKRKIEFKDGFKLFILYLDSVICLKFEQRQIETCLKKLQQ